jgi:hypothetical protein
VPAGASALRAGGLEQRSELGLYRRELGLKLVAVVVLVLVGPPRGEHLAGERHALLAEGLLFRQAVGVAAKSRCRCDQQTWRWLGSRWA